MPRVSTIRIGVLEDLARQLRFAPARTVGAQVARIEHLAGEIEPGRAYPEDWLLFRITGYRAQIEEPALLPGDALLAELSALAEHLSDAARLSPDDEPDALTLDQLGARWSVSRRTIQRYRRRGLIARRVIDDTGHAQLRFSLPVVERFEQRQPALLARARAFARMTPDERRAVTDKARALAQDPGTSRARAIRRAARSHDRSPEAVRLALRSADPPADPASLDTPARRAILDAHERGVAISVIAADVSRSRATVWRIINEMRAERLRGLHIDRLTGGISFDDATIARALDHHSTSNNLDQQPILEATALVEAARSLSPIDPASERARSTACHALLIRAVDALHDLDRANPSARRLDEIETHLRAATLIKRALLLSARAVILRAVEDRLGAPLLDFGNEDIRRVHAAAMTAAARAIDGFAPESTPPRGGRLAARVSLAVERALTPLARELGPHPGARRLSRARVRLDDVSGALTPWHPFLRLGADRPAIESLLDPPDAEAVLLRFGLTGERPLTMRAVRDRTGIAPRRQLDLWRTVRGSLHQHHC